MWPALLRAIEAAPPTELADLRRSTHELVALRCHMPGCTECAAFETERQADFEDELRRFRGVQHVVAWNCANARHRRLALDAGVDALPAYVLLSSASAPAVVKPNPTDDASSST